MKHQPPTSQLEFSQLADVDRPTPARYNPMLARIGPANPGRYCFSCVYLWEFPPEVGEPYPYCLFDNAEPPVPSQPSWHGCLFHVTEIENTMSPVLVAQLKSRGLIVYRASQLEAIPK